MMNAMMNVKLLNASLKAAGHYFDFDNKVLYVTKSYLAKAETYGTVECDRLNEMMAQFPGMKIEIHKKSRTNNAISYEMMEGFIRIMPQAEWRMKEYQRIKQVSLAYKSPYKFVCAWFEKQFPYYGKLTAHDENGTIKWDAVAMYNKAAEEAKARAVGKDGTIVSFPASAVRTQEMNAENLLADAS